MCKQKFKSKDAVVLTIGTKKYVFGSEKNGLRQQLTGKARQKYLRRTIAARKLCLEESSCLQEMLETAVSLKISADGELIVIQGKRGISFFLNIAETELYSLRRNVNARSYASYFEDRVIVVDFGGFKIILCRDKYNRLIEMGEDFLSVDVCDNGEILATSTTYRSIVYIYDEARKELTVFGYC